MFAILLGIVKESGVKKRFQGQEGVMEADRKAPRKQRHTAHRIWSRLKAEHPEIDIGESTVRRYVRLRKLCRKRSRGGNCWVCGGTKNSILKKDDRLRGCTSQSLMKGERQRLEG
jgi:hypothetical protein